MTASHGPQPPYEHVFATIRRSNDEEIRVTVIRNSASDSRVRLRVWRAAEDCRSPLGGDIIVRARELREVVDTLTEAMQALADFEALT